MPKPSFRYALNTALRGLVSLEYGMPNIEDGDFLPVPSDYSYFGVIHSGGPFVDFKHVTFITADVLNLLQYRRIKAHQAFIIELEQYEDLMGIQ